MPPRQRTEEQPPYFEGDYVVPPPPPPPPPPPLMEFLGIAQLAQGRPGFAACLRYCEQTDGPNPADRIRAAASRILVSGKWLARLRDAARQAMPGFENIIVASFIVIQTRYLLLRGAIHRADPRILMIGEDGLVAYLREYSALYDRAKARMMQLIARPGEHRHHRGFLRLQRAALAWMRQKPLAFCDEMIRSSRGFLMRRRTERFRMVSSQRRQKMMVINNRAEQS
ncbi:unnamed protein product, partial [Mesorhabditis spiculigera]